MAFKESGEALVEPEVAIHHIRVTLTSCNVKPLEKVCTKVKNLKMNGPLWMVTGCTLLITTRKTRGGKGSKIWHHFQLCILMYLIDLQSPTEIME
ncbi:40S ribosomal protein S20-like [Sorex araneus]|uniref:40S ribosomal protein S20-like n=1 Tax=Sorex araneus TaxID=42254 RepID=UPI000649A138|nr:40S ribosomal protein S20-like [Sorex araneus]